MGLDDAMEQMVESSAANEPSHLNPYPSEVLWVPEAAPAIDEELRQSEDSMGQGDGLEETVGLGARR
jgi:hypothetical protein